MNGRFVLSVLGLVIASAAAAEEACPTRSDGGQCLREAAASARSAGLASAADVERRLRAGERLHLIDLRPESIALRDPLPQATALTTLQLRTKRAWREEAIILLGSGAAYASLERAREELTSAGFAHVAVLDGGARFWRSNIERYSHRSNETLIPPQAIDLVTDAGRWTLLEIGVEAPRPLPGVHRVGLALDSADRVAQAALGALPRGRDQIANVLVVGPNDRLAAEVAGRLQRRARANVFALEGGWSAWEEGQALHDRLVAAAAGERRAHAVGVCW